MSALFTSWRKDPGAEYLKTGYRQFRSRHGIDGLARIKGYHLEIVAVQATAEGTGQFRRFITACKEKFDTVTVWQIHNERLPAVLARYGFTPVGPVPEDDEPGAVMIEGLRWEREG